MHFDTVETATEGRCIPESPWFCGQVTVGREKSFADSLVRIGVETFLPRIRTHRKRHKYDWRIQDSTLSHYTPLLPLFPGYLFARLDNYDWARIKTKLGIGLAPRWIDFGAGPVEIPEDLIGMLRAGQSLDVPGTEYPVIHEGQPVDIVEGPWTGLTGVFNQSLKGGERVLVLMTVLGALRPVEFARGQIRSQTY